MILETSLSTLNYSFKIGNLCYDFPFFFLFKLLFLKICLKGTEGATAPLVNKSAVKCKQMKRFHIPYSKQTSISS